MRRTIWNLPSFKLLNRIGYSAKVSREDETELRLILFFILFLVFSFFIYLALPPFLDSLSSPDALDVFIQIGTMLVSLELMREIIASELEALKKYEREKTEDEIARRKRAQDSQILAHRYYVSQIVGTPSGLKFEDLNLQPVSNAFLSSQVPLYDLGFSNFQDRRLIRCELINIPEDFWQSLALSASMYVLNKSISEEIDVKPNYFLFQDLYAYLRAWLVCSIDNDGGKPMPIAVIGLHYPNEESPNVRIYLDALFFIKNDLLERDGPKNICAPSILKSVKDRLDQLIQLIDSYYREE